MIRNVILEVQGLVKIYGDGAEVRALDGVNLTVHEGEFLAIVGPSGSGKSTLLNLIGALDRPTSGRVVVRGTDLAEVKDLDTFRSRTVGFVFQLHNLIPTLTAAENIEVPMYETVPDARQRRERAVALLRMVGLGERLEFLPQTLSGGERQRVAIARALANQPAIILADEPTGNLDSASGEEVMRALADLNARQGTTIIVVTHNPAVARATQRVVTLRDGRIVDDHPVADPLAEDLHSLIRSELGRVLLKGDYERLKSAGLMEDDRLSKMAVHLRELLEGIDSGS